MNYISRRRAKLHPIVAVAALLVGLNCFGAPDEQDASLAGIQKLDLSLNFINLDEETEGTIRTDVELRLRQAGIQIGDVEVSSTESRTGTVLAPKANRPPKLVLNATGPRTCDISLGIRQAVRLQRNPSIALLDNQTWVAFSPGVRISAECDHLRSDVQDLLSKFLNAWLSVRKPDAALKSGK